MYLIFDTETTGFPSKGLHRSDPKQARIIQLGMLLLDKNFKELAAIKTLIRSEGAWRISSGAQQAHGISQQECDDYGTNIEPVIKLFHDFKSRAGKVVAHNIAFDKQLIDIESDIETDWTHPKYVCTMQLMTPICKLPSQRTTYKWPKLQEAYQYCFKEDFKGAHDAMADVRATARVLKWLVENRHVTL